MLLLQSTTNYNTRHDTTLRTCEVEDGTRKCLTLCRGLGAHETQTASNLYIAEVEASTQIYISFAVHAQYAGDAPPPTATIPIKVQPPTTTSTTPPHSFTRLCSRRRRRASGSCVCVRRTTNSEHKTAHSSGARARLILNYVLIVFACVCVCSSASARAKIL